MGGQPMNAEPDPFLIRAHVADFDAHVGDYRAASEASREILPHRLDVAYGDRPDEKLDLFFPRNRRAGGRLPVHIFVHGGYWRAFSRKDYAFVADIITARGAIAAIIDYSLMQGARMATLVAQVRRAARWVVDKAATFGGDPDAVSASGHSAGGHLASYLVGRGPHEDAFPDIPIRSATLVSGIYDLRPIARSFLQAEIRLTSDETAAWSPRDAFVRQDCRVRLVVGASETLPFLEQSNAGQSHPRPWRMTAMEYASTIF